MFNRPYLLVAVGVVVLLVLFFIDKVQWMDWVGTTDVDVVFIVTDSSDQPIDDAVICIWSSAGFPGQPEDQVITLPSNKTGTANRLYQDTLISGTRSGLGFTDTWGVLLPDWHFQVSAPGRAPTDWISLWAFSKNVEYLGTGTCRLVVRVTLDNEP